MVEDLARRFEVSAQTIRKDLNDLCDHHVLTRIHGGAIIASGVENLAYEARRFVAAEEKKAIGAAAAALIPNGCSLFINIGTTTEEVASALTSHEDLLVITNNLNVAMLLYRHPRIEVIVAGGAVPPNPMITRMMVSTNWPLTVEPTVRVQSALPPVHSFIFASV